MPSSRATPEWSEKQLVVWTASSSVHTPVSTLYLSTLHVFGVAEVGAGGGVIHQSQNIWYNFCPLAESWVFEAWSKLERHS